MKIARLSFAVALLVASLWSTVPAEATTRAVCGSVSCTDRIARLYVTDNAGASRVYFSIADRQLVNANLNCNLVNGYYFTLEESHPAFDEIYDLIVKTKFEGTRILIRVVAGSPICEVDYVFLD